MDPSPRRDWPRRQISAGRLSLEPSAQPRIASSYCQFTKLRRTARRARSLCQRRRNQTRRFSSTEGSSLDRLEPVGYGERRPITAGRPHEPALSSGMRRSASAPDAPSRRIRPQCCRPRSRSRCCRKRRLPGRPGRRSWRRPDRS